MKKGRYVATTTGRKFHLRNCTEVDEYKAPSGVMGVTDSDIRRRKLTPCKICRPVILWRVK